MKILSKLFTNLKTGEQMTALEFNYPTYVKVLAGGAVPSLGYVDMDQVDDLLLALEKIVENTNNISKQDNFQISYTTTNGLDVYFTTSFPGQPGPVVLFRKKWYFIDDYGVQTSKHSEEFTMVGHTALPKVIDAIKEAQAIANQALAK